MNPPILPALDALQSGAASLPDVLKNARLGLITNHTGVTQNGVSTQDVLRGLGCEIGALFSPEHGPAGTEEGDLASSQLPDGTPIYSLYGATRRPTEEMLRGLDALVFDIQDVGARFYTYASTLTYALEECAPRRLPMIILDRPNPLGGEEIEGPQLDVSTRNFVAHIQTPIVHGLTLGEIAHLHNFTENLNAEFHVVRVQNWRRKTLWNETGLRWNPPSPNLPDFRSAQWYPATCILEFSGVSVGRGTDAPFQYIGAPWLQPARALEAAQNWPRELRKNVHLSAVQFTPTRATHEGVLCNGIFLDTKDLSTQNIKKTHLGLALLAAIHHTHSDELDEAKLRAASPLIGTPRVLELLLQNDLEAALQICEADEKAFANARRPHLFYA